MKKAVTAIIIVLVALVIIALIFDWGRPSVFAPNIDQTVTSTLNGVTDQISISYPKENNEVTNPIKITGKARGNWFFEAQFPVKLMDSDGNIIASTSARAESDWMTTDYVNFSAEISYPKSTTTQRAILVLSKDNPSDDPKFDAFLYIPVLLK